MDLRFLESIKNLKRVVKASIGREPSTETAQQISSCLQQGRLFFEAATKGAPEIRPLLLSYGTMAFARATVIARTLTNLENLPTSHGIRDISSTNALLRDLRIKVVGDGTFQRIVETARSVERMSLLIETNKAWIKTPSCASTDLKGAELTLKDILARVGSLERLFRETFEEDAQVLYVSIFHPPGSAGVYELRIDVPVSSRPSIADVIKVLGDLRNKFPFLNGLNFREAWFAWDHLGINFDNIAPGGVFPSKEADVSVDNPGRFNPSYKRSGLEAGGVELDKILPCAQGGLIGGSPTFSSSLNGAYLSEIVLLYLGVYLLGSLVRYRPQIWVHALYDHATPSRARDDATQSIVEAFLNLVTSAVPSWCEEAIRAPRLQ